MQATVAFVAPGTPAEPVGEGAVGAGVADVEAGTLTSEQLEAWHRMEPALFAVWYDAEATTSDERILVEDAFFPIRLLWVRGGLSLSVPVFATGASAPASVARLVDELVRVVERETGLVAWDPATDTPLRPGDGLAASGPLRYGSIPPPHGAPAAPEGSRSASSSRARSCRGSCCSSWSCCSRRSWGPVSRGRGRRPGRGDLVGRARGAVAIGPACTAGTARRPRCRGSLTIASAVGRVLRPARR